MEPSVSVQHLGKRYQLRRAEDTGRYKTFRESLSGLATAPLRRLRARGASGGKSEDFWALRDVSFDVQPGEVVGIIGRNGAGKSTLLKVLSRITKPTSGRVQLRGRVGSLLEVGTGFHPELTGRENVFLNGSILGMGRAEIARRFDEIVAFAEVEKFLDTPVKRYSSGMYVKLAFAVAAHLEPELLIVDEVLAVGDASFQKKCLAKMVDIGRSGRTVLFVSHDLHAISKLTDRCLLLHQGCVEEDGATIQVIGRYLSTGAGYQSEWISPAEHHSGIRIAAVRVRGLDDQIRSHFQADEEFRIEVDVTAASPGTAQVAFRLNSATTGETIFTSAMSDESGVRDAEVRAGRHKAICTVPAHLLRPGDYCLLVAINNFEGPKHDLIESVLRFEITSIGSPVRFDNRLGAIAPILSWSCDYLPV